MDIGSRIMRDDAMRGGQGSDGRWGRSAFGGGGRAGCTRGAVSWPPFFLPWPPAGRTRHPLTGERIHSPDFRRQNSKERCVRMFAK